MTRLIKVTHASTNPGSNGILSSEILCYRILCTHTWGLIFKALGSQDTSVGILVCDTLDQ